MTNGQDRESADMWSEIEWREALDADRDPPHPWAHLWLMVGMLLMYGGIAWMVLR